MADTFVHSRYRDNVPLLPIHPNFVMPRNPYGLVAHVLTFPETLPCSWTPWVDDVIVWPSPPLLYHVSNEYRVNVLLPHLYMPSPDLSSTLLYMTYLQSEWPPTPVGVPSIAFLDTPVPLRTEGICDGVRYWEMTYGYPENLRFVTCVCNDRNRTFVPQSEVMLRIFKSMFESLAVPYTDGIRTT